MSELERKVDAILRLLTSETNTDYDRTAEEIRSLMESPSAGDAPSADSAAAFDVDAEVRNILLDVGVPEHIKGYPRLVRAICIAVEKPDVLNSITGELYPMVASDFNDTPSRVERAMRHAIESACDRGGYDMMVKYFGNTISLNKDKPTNSEFVARISNMVRQRMKVGA